MPRYLVIGDEFNPWNGRIEQALDVNESESPEHALWTFRRFRKGAPKLTPVNEADWINGPPDGFPDDAIAWVSEDVDTQDGYTYRVIDLDRLCEWNSRKEEE